MRGFTLVAILFVLVVACSGAKPPKPTPGPSPTPALVVALSSECIDARKSMDAAKTSDEFVFYKARLVEQGCTGDKPTLSMKDVLTAIAARTPCRTLGDHFQALFGAEQPDFRYSAGEWNIGWRFFSGAEYVFVVAEATRQITPLTDAARDALSKPC